MLQAFLKLSVILVFKEMDLAINMIPKCKIISSFGVELEKYPSFL